MAETTEQIWAVLNLVQVGTWLRDELEATLASRAGLSLAEHEVLMVLSRRAAPVPLGELAELVFFSQSGMTRLFDRLERKGLAGRKLSNQDRRVVYGVLTEEGRVLVEQEAKPLVADTVYERFGRHLSEEDVAQLRRILFELMRGNGWWDERRHSHQAPDRPAGANGRGR